MRYAASSFEFPDDWTKVIFDHGIPPFLDMIDLEDYVDPVVKSVLGTIAYFGMASHLQCVI